MSKIDCRNHLKNGCCILTGGECTHETCTIKEPELQTANKESQDERMAVLIAETIFYVYGESQEYKDVVAWLKEHVQVDILDEEERELPKPTQSLMNEAILAFPDDKEKRDTYIKEKRLEIAVNNAAEKYTDNPDNYATWTEHYGDFATVDDIALIEKAFKAGVTWYREKWNKLKGTEDED